PVPVQRHGRAPLRAGRPVFPGGGHAAQFPLQRAPRSDRHQHGFRDHSSVRSRRRRAAARREDPFARCRGRARRGDRHRAPFLASGTGAPVALVAPIVAAYPVVTALVSMIALREETVTARALLGSAITVAAIVYLVASR